MIHKFSIEMTQLIDTRFTQINKKIKITIPSLALPRNRRLKPPRGAIHPLHSTHAYRTIRPTK